MITRQVNGGPLVDPEGNPLSGVRVSFELIDCAGNPMVEVDSFSGDVISGYVSVITDAGGLFVVGLWPNSRGVSPTQYRCTIGQPNVSPFLIQVPESSNPLAIFDAMSAGGLPPC